MTATTYTQDESAKTDDSNFAVRIWLYSICALIFAMVVVGGATRLTDSGLSITEWKPIVGIIPPLGDADWHDAFEKYKQIPEYKRVNHGMSLEEFKGIFWWEWAHRFLGRMIGFAFFIPFLALLLMGKINRALVPRLVGLFVLGGLQGALGWYMVKSGLVDRVDVSQYRLTAHLGLAFLIFAATFWVALGLRPEAHNAAQRSGQGDAASNPYAFSALILLVLVFAQIILGAFVAGTDAGFSHNTWPLMDGGIIPQGLFVQSPWYMNLFENVATVQFNHRMMAYLVWAFALVHLIRVWLNGSNTDPKSSALLVFLLLTAQAALGIWTLLAVVPISLGVAHQAGALIVFAAAIYHMRRAREA